MTSAHVGPVPVTVRVPAKINLELRVGPRRRDGYHDLATVFQAVSLYDDVTVGVIEGEDFTCEVVGGFPEGVPTGKDNLAVQAARLLHREYPQVDAVSISIAKGIPVAGGMAGGSADAAATLVACDRLWGLGLAKEDLEEYGALLGSDVPFLVAGGTAIGTGRGESLAPVLARGTFHWVLALAGEGLSTPAVYAECDRLRAGSRIAAPRPNPRLMAALRSGDAAELAPHLANDLESAAVSLRPSLRDVLDSGLEYGALAGIVSGSGPTVAFLVAGQEAGIDLAVALTASGTASDVRRVHGPVHGAHTIPTPVD